MSAEVWFVAPDGARWLFGARGKAMMEYRVNGKLRRVVGPFGRIVERTMQLVGDERWRAACKHGRNLNEPSELKIFATREAMVRAVRKGERKELGTWRWRAVVALGETEGL